MTKTDIQYESEIIKELLKQKLFSDGNITRIINTIDQYTSILVSLLDNTKSLENIAWKIDNESIKKIIDLIIAENKKSFEK